MKPRHRIPDPNWVPGTQPKPAMTPTEMSQRWPTSPPDNLALPLGQWVDPDTAEQLLMAANGSTDRETAK